MSEAAGVRTVVVSTVGLRRADDEEETMTAPQLEETRSAWDGIAAGYDRHVGTRNVDLATAALDRLGPAAGRRLLDVAAGSGALSVTAARRGFEVTAVDLSPAMIGRLRARADDQGLHIDARVMDGHALDLGDDSFDVAASVYGVMVFPDLQRGLRELARVTRPGGKVLVVSFGALPPDVEMIGFTLAAMTAVVPGFDGLPGDGPPPPFQVADPDVLRRRMTDAGLVDVTIERDVHTMRFTSGADLWDAFCSSHPIGAALGGGLGADQRTDVQRVLDGMLAERAETGDALLRTPVNVGVGTA